MPISDKDREIWRKAMQGVQPIQHDQVPRTSQSCVQIHPVSNVNHTWDLHGMTLMDAHEKVNREIDQSRESFKYMTFITGKSGQMQKEFAHWLTTNSHVSRCEPLNDGGAFRIWFKKDRHKHK